MNALIFLALVAVLAVVVGLFGFWVGSAALGLALALTVVGLAFCYHSVHLYRLIRWLKTADVHTIPSSTGVWQVVFEELLAQTKGRKKREQKLHQALERQNRIIAAIPSGVLILSSQGRIEWKNALAEEYLGLSLTWDKKGILKNLVRSPEFHQFLDDAEQERSISTTAKLSMHHTQPNRTLWLTSVPFEANATILIAHDISASEQLNLTRSAFIANVSHELRTPLTVISGFLETLQDMPELDEPTRLEFIHLMQKESARMLSLIEDLLTLSRLENQSYQGVEFEPVALSELVESIVENAKPLAHAHTLIANIDESIWVMGVYKDLYSALSNLIFNAIHHTPQGTTVAVGLTATEDKALFFVADTGDGIAPEHLAHLTERFYRVDKGRSRKTGGSGLGLAIAKHALATHGATLQIESMLGTGSTFKAEFCQIPPDA
ncbi:MAG: phosphate regulon sensor histidine kinase PhoR [Moraxella sp.]|nr:phosphate regulon sensor histidine kinase PhoR [Moraxella sp.]